MIRSVVFDIGGVLVRPRYQPFIEYLEAAGIDMSDLPAWLQRVGLVEHERGEQTGEQLLGRVSAMARRPLDADELKARWLGMFERWHEMCDLAEGLKERYRVFLLSNIGDLHWQHLDQQYGLERLAHGVLASYRVGAVKPSVAIYREAERRFALEPSATVFIDDLPPNVVAAEACGWRAIRHRDAAATRAGLRAVGVQLPPPFDTE